MTANRIFLVMTAIVVVLAVGSSVAEYAGSVTESVWVAAAIGIALSLAAGVALRPFRKRAEEAGYFERSEGNRISRLTALVMMVAIVGLATYQILHSGADEFGNVNYSKPAVGGFWIGTAIFWIWINAKSRQLDSTQ